MVNNADPAAQNNAVQMKLCCLRSGWKLFCFRFSLFRTEEVVNFAVLAPLIKYVASALVENHVT
jgi:hypothetical protein